MSMLKAPAVRYTIGELGRLFEVTARTLRFYEEKSLLEPERDGTGRLYTRRDFRRMQVIVKGRRAGLRLEQIQDLLAAYDPTDQGRAQIDRGLDLLRERAEQLERQRAYVAEEIFELERRRQRLGGSSASSLAAKELSGGARAASAIAAQRAY